MFKSNSKMIVLCLVSLYASSAFAMGKRSHSQNPTPSPTPTPTPTSTEKSIPQSSPQSSSVSSPGSDIFDSIKNGLTNETPFEVLKSLYDKGTPTMVSEFPTYDDCVRDGNNFLPLRQLSSWVVADSKVEKLNMDYRWAYVVKNLKVVVSKPVDGGPLFPTPENDLIFPNFFAFGTPGTCIDQPDSDLASELLKDHYSLVDANEGATQSIHFNNEDGSLKYSSQDVFHTFGKTIIMKTLNTQLAKNGTFLTVESYNYMWHQR